jgi:non-ribosomal peptide synthase protein (TIGR01720 family)
LFEQLDTNETVGWFTTVYPLLLSEQREADLGTLIKSVKEQYRALPNRGFGYGVLTQIVGDEELRTAGERLAAQAVEFNYLGQFDGTINHETAFSAARESAGYSAAPANPQSAALSINSMVHEGQLGVSIVADISCHDLSGFSALIEAALRACVSHCHYANLEQELHQRYADVFDDSDDAVEAQGFEL